MTIVNSSETHMVQSAIVGNSAGGVELSHSVPIPTAKGDIALVCCKAVSVNPVDAKMRGPYVTAGAILGCDFAGVVEEVGVAGGLKYDIKKGDRVCGAIMGMNPLEPNHGAFAEHIGAPVFSLVRLPDSVSFETGSALCTCFMSVGLALFKSLELPGYPLQPTRTPLTVLVYGGSTSTGTAALQLLRLAGFQPIAICSQHSFALAESYGAEAVFDYHAPDCAASVRAHTRNGVRYVLDCITTRESMEICYAALGRSGGRYTALDPYSEAVAQSRKVVKPDWVLGPSMLGGDIAWPAPHGRKADPELYNFGQKWRNTVQELLDKGLIREHPILVQPGGLARVMDALEAVASKSVSGQKIVCRMPDLE